MLLQCIKAILAVSIKPDKSITRIYYIILLLDLMQKHNAV